MSGTNAVTPDPISDAMTVRLRALRTRLLALHKVLLDAERINYERAHGALSNSDMLQLAINHEQFGWLHPISELIVRIDEVLEPEPSSTEGSAELLVTEARRLLSPDEEGEGFARKYFQALQHDPAAVLAHRAVKLVLS